MIIDTAHYYSLLARNEPIPESAIVELLQAAEKLQTGLAYVASCQAATLESLRKSTSKSEKQRQISITETCAAALIGNVSAIRYPEKPATARERCLRAVAAAKEIT